MTTTTSPPQKSTPQLALPQGSCTPMNLFDRGGAACARLLDDCPEETLLEPADGVDTLISTLVINAAQDARRAITCAKESHASYAETEIWLNALQPQQPRFLIFTLGSYGSQDPLRITKEDLQALVIEHDIGAEFSSVVNSFGDLPRHSEYGLNCLTRSMSADGSFTISYLLRFAEQDLQQNWKIRQVGVYHRSVKATNTNLCFLLQSHPEDESVLSTRLQAVAEHQQSARDLYEDPVILHELLMNVYLQNWRRYLMLLGNAFAHQVLTVRMKKGEIFDLTLDTLQQMKYLLETLMQLPAIFKATIDILTSLEIINNSHVTTLATNNVTYSMSQVLDAQRSTSVLIQQLQGIIDLVGNSLDLKNQDDAGKINKHLLDLTLRTVRDSATIRVITIVTFVYLPANFVASLFGMNFFAFNDTTRKLRISPDIWMYILLFLAFEAITCAYGVRTLWTRKKSKDVEKSIPLAPYYGHQGS